MAITTFPHGPIQRLGSSAWVVQAPTSQTLPRTMVVARGTDGALFVHDPLRLDDARFAELDRLGPVRAIFVPSFLHDFDAEAFAARYPAAVLCAMRGTIAKLKWPNLVPLEPAHVPPGITVERIPGVKGEVVVEVRHADGGVTLVFNDALFNLPHQPGWRGLVLRALGSSGPLHMSPIGRLFLLKDRAAFRGWLEAQAARSDLRNVVVAHGDLVLERAGEKLAAAAARL